MKYERDVRTGRESHTQCRENFSDIHPSLTNHQAAVESDRCYFCFDAPCVHACPTGIDIPSFIHKIRTGNTVGSAKDILDANIFGAMCARVCPVETLCEQACVRNVGEEKPVKIGALQRYATDHVLEKDMQLFKRQAPTGWNVAIVGGGPAGLSCAHRLAMLGHKAVVYEARPKLGGLNEYGIAAYKVPDNIAQREIDYLLEIGGIEVEVNKQLGREIKLEELRRDFDAVYLGFGLAGVKSLGIDGEFSTGVLDAVRYIEDIRQTSDLLQLPVGRRIVVIGGGMTAIDIAVQTKSLGAEDVAIIYRRGPHEMGASRWERDFAQSRGVNIRYWARPKSLMMPGGEVTAIELEYTRSDGGKLVGTGETYTLPADMVFKAIGQKLVPDPLDADKSQLLDTEGGRIAVDENRRTSLKDVWAGGDCIGISQDLTVAAVQDGKIAAHDIDRTVRQARVHTAA